MKLDVRENRLFWGGIDCERSAGRYGTPLYVYDEQMLRDRAGRLRAAFTWPATRLLYSAKANTNLAVLKIVRQEKFGLDAVSPGEVAAGLRAGFHAGDIFFTGNNLTDEELKFAIEHKVGVNVDSLSALERFGRLGPGGRVSVRVNPDVGAGHHAHVITGGPDSKFGVWHDQVPEIMRLADEYGLKITGLHQHIGSGIRTAAIFAQAMTALLKIARQFMDLEFIDFGGGLGVPYIAGQRPLDVARLGGLMSRRFETFCRQYGRRLTMMLEPGRYLAAESGILLARVNTIKTTPKHVFVGTDSGFNHLIRHPLYCAHHEIVNASRVKGRRRLVAVTGNICESGDLFTHGRKITGFREGDLAAIMTAGAYGFVMSSQYNSRPRPAEVLVNKGRSRLIRRRETIDDMFRNQC